MTSEIFYKDKWVPLNNTQFAGLIDLVVEVGCGTATTPADKDFAARMVRLKKEKFWPGRGIRIEEDFPDLEEQKFWARVFLDTARAVFDRRVGRHEHAFWQTLCIYQAYATGRLFIEAVRDRVGYWFPDTIDGREADRFVNKRESS